jgi:hypothetical protein
MFSLRRGLTILTLVLAAPTLAPAQDPGAPPGSGYLRADWSVETTKSGRARLVGYLYNSSIKDAANVWLRVEQRGTDGAVSATSRTRLVGDIPSQDRLFFDVPVSGTAATYTVLVESVDWIKECR